MKAQQVLENVLGTRLTQLSDITEYLTSILEDNSLEYEEAFETISPMIEGAGTN